ncbi:hypothetical protein A3G12_02480 [Candidatus Kaiserbacteria bacterium RIFCSPLOWO2_12_FULL_54_10]|nr:MAG: hypothetical protein A3G12_02480 [Candidatus Kaiserbacteria bacterium RIFCSPLOWO2_12_FULL_54_10]
MHNPVCLEEGGSMASKKKANGCTSVRCVEKAIRKCGCTVHEFFKRAVCNKDTVRDFDIDAAVKRFLDFKKYGLVANSYYGIPRFVIAFAEVVLYGEHPRVPRKYRVRHSTRPSISAGGH